VLAIFYLHRPRVGVLVTGYIIYLLKCILGESRSAVTPARQVKEEEKGTEEKREKG
jgi:hypothetical protein